MTDDTVHDINLEMFKMHRKSRHDMYRRSACDLRIQLISGLVGPYRFDVTYYVITQLIINSEGWSFNLRLKFPDNGEGRKFEILSNAKSRHGTPPETERSYELTMYSTLEERQARRQARSWSLHLITICLSCIWFVRCKSLDAQADLHKKWRLKLKKNGIRGAQSKGVSFDRYLTPNADFL